MVEAAWEKAKQIDNTITRKYMKYEEHSYFKTDYFKQIEKMYKNALKYIEENQARFKNKAEEDTNSAEALQKKQLRAQEILMQQFQKALTQAELELAQQKPSHRYEFLKTKLDKQWDEISKKNLEICVNETKFQSTYFTDEEFEKLEQQYDEIVEKLHNMLASTTIINNGANQRNISLPQIKIQFFVGKYENWVTFEDLFNRLVDTNSTPTNVEKMQYLKTHVKGEASRVIQHLQISNSNYEAAWDLLKKRYSNQRLLVSKLLNKILEFPPFHLESASKIKEHHSYGT